jgi:hypothetical protein
MPTFRIATTGINRRIKAIRKILTGNVFDDFHQLIDSFYPQINHDIGFEIGLYGPDIFT